VAARLASVFVGILCLEGGLFRQIIPVALAGALAAWDVAAPGASPAALLVRWVGRPPVAFVPRGDVRRGQGALAVACLAAVVAAAAGATTLAWVLAVLAGLAGILACILGRPALGLGPPGDRPR
jgi:hypothetical protein